MEVEMSFGTKRIGHSQGLDEFTHVLIGTCWCGIGSIEDVLFGLCFREISKVSNERLIHRRSVVGL
jgi:hypothetical protein